MLKEIQEYIDQHQLLIKDNRPIIVGFSGGADSVALLVLLSRLGYCCIAAHCNFHLRGEESNRDEVFSCSLAEKWKIPYHKIDFQTEEYARKNHLSIEMAARELRYSWFEELLKEYQAQAIAVAHHSDDNVETVLLNLIRGTGIRGICGIQPKNGNIIRPFLTVSREKILSWLKKEGFDYVIDSTNLSDIYKRNYIRLNVIPILEQLNPQVKEAISRMTEHLSPVKSIYLHTIEQIASRVWVAPNILSITALLDNPEPKTILYELLKPYNFSSSVTAKIYHSLLKESGKCFYSSTYRLVKAHNELILNEIKEKEENFSYIILSDIDVNHLPIKLSFEINVLSETLQFDTNKFSAWFDADKLQFPLELRRWKNGDWFVPFGMKGRKKISDYFTDHKFSIAQKEETWLLCHKNDIIWIVGERTDNRYRIDKTTKRVLSVVKN